jgi:hypothetical protein
VPIVIPEDDIARNSMASRKPKRCGIRRLGDLGVDVDELEDTVEAASACWRWR